MSSRSPSLSPRMRRTVAVALAAALLLALRALLPVAAAALLERAAGDATGLSVAVDDVDLELLAGRVAVKGMSAWHAEDVPAQGPPDPAAALLRWGRLAGDLEWLDLLSGRLRLASVELASPRLALERDAAGNLVLPVGSAGAGEDDPGGEPSGFSLVVDRFDLADLDLRLRDRRSRSHESAALDLRLATLSLRDLRIEGQRLELGALDLEEPSLSVRRDAWLGRTREPPAEGSDEQGEPTAEGSDASEPTAEGSDEQGEPMAEGSDEQGEPMAEGSDEQGEPTAEGSDAQGEPTAEGSDGAHETAELESAGATPEPPDAPPRLRIANVQVQRADFVLETDRGPVEVALRLTAQGVSVEPEETFPVDLGLALGEGTFELSGRLGLAPLRFDGDVSWQDLPQAPLLLAALPARADWLKSSRASGNAALRLVPAGGDLPAHLLLDGRGQVSDFELASPGDEPELRLAWKTLDVAMKELRLPLDGSAARATLGRVRLEAPELHWTRLAADDDGQGASEASAASEEAPEAAVDAAPESDGAQPALRLHRLEIVDGRVSLEDRTVEPAFRGEADALQLEADAIVLPEPRLGGLLLRGQGPEGSTFRLEGDVAPGDGHLDFRLERLALPRLNPYVLTAGYRVERGAATLESGVRLRAGGADISNSLVLHDLALDRAAGDGLEAWLGMPPNAALALLRDLSGDVRLQIPVSIDDGATTVDVASTLRGAVRAAVIGSVTAPLKLLGASLAMVDGKVELGLDPIRFEPGRAAIAAGQDAEIEALADFLESRPLVQLVLLGRAGPDDRDGLVERILSERAEAGAEGEPPGVAAAGEEEQARLERRRAEVEVPAARYAELARERARRLREALMDEHRIALERLVVAEATDEGSPAVLLDARIVTPGDR